MGWSFVPSTKIAITKQKIDFWPQISKFWGKKSTFSPLAANWSLTDQCFQHEKGVSLGSRYEGTKIFTPCPQKIGFWAQKRPNLAQNWHFGPNISIFGPFDLVPDQKTMGTSCLDGFLLSSPRAKRAGPKGLRAESARAFTGRRNSHSGRGEDFLTGQPNFFTETAVTPERKVEKSFPRWEINRHVEG